MDHVARIRRMTAHVASEMSRAAAHRQLLERHDPDQLPLHDAIVEKAVRDAQIANVVAYLERALDRGGLPPDLTRAIRQLLDECEQAAARLSNAPGEQ